MLKHLSFLGSAAAAVLLAGSVAAQDATAETVVATVGDVEITLGEVIIARTQLPQQYAQFPESVLFEGLIDQLIQQQLLSNTITEIPRSIEMALTNERRTLIAGEAISTISENAVTDADVQAAYDERYADAEEIPEFRASHLLVETEEEAVAAKQRIDDGAAFADVARDVSTGPTGPNGGDLGWFGQGAMVPEFENTITALDVGGVSDPFETQFGWHVATLVEQRSQPQPTLDQVGRDITAELQEAAITARLEELEATTEVVRPEADAFDPALIGRLDLLE